MSSIEQRLARDIEAEMRGVVVTESDVQNAREDVEDRIAIERKRSHGSTLRSAAIAAVVISILGVGIFQVLDSGEKSARPTSTTPKGPNAEDAFLTGSAPTPDLIAGVWRVDNGSVLMKFSTDGAIRFDDGGQLYSDPDAIGTYEITGDLISVTVDGGTAGCAGQTFAMRAALPEFGAMRFVHTQPGTGNCTPENAVVDDAPPTTEHLWWDLEQALPTNSKYLAGLENSADPTWKPLRTGNNALNGDWLAGGGGFMLELAPDGAYYIADKTADVVDRGRWSLRGRDLTLTSFATSGECAEGDRLVLAGLEQIDPGTLVLRGTVQQNTCLAAWTPSEWIRFPQASP